MTPRERINEYFNGSAFMTLCAVGLVAMALVARVIGVQVPVVEGHGIFFSFKDLLIADGTLSTTVNVLCLLMTGGILLAVNKIFTFVRSLTRLSASAFYLLALAHPQGLAAFNVGTLMCLLAVLTLPLLFAAYQDRHSQRSIFLVFALAATGCMFHYGFLVLIPAYLLGFLYMGVMNLKGVLAMLFGVVTPFWIVLGLGIAAPADALAPQWLLTDLPSMTMLVILAASTAVLGIALALMNLHTIMNYRMQPRVYNAFLIVMLVFLVIGVVLDYRDIAVYLPLLSLLTAVQVAQVHTLRIFPYRYLFLLLFIAGCLGFSAANLMII